MLSIRPHKEFAMPVQMTRSSAYRTPCVLKALTLVAMLWSAVSVGATAEDQSAPMFSFNGFGTLGVVHSSEENADFVGGVFQPSGAGFTHRWSAGVDSRIGGQVSANFTQKLSAVVQLVSEQRYDNTYIPSVEWANIRYQITP